MLKTLRRLCEYPFDVLIIASDFEKQNLMEELKDVVEFSVTQSGFKLDKKDFYFFEYKDKNENSFILTLDEKKEYKIEHSFFGYESISNLSSIDVDILTGFHYVDSNIKLKRIKAFESESFKK